jgi:hypothetical protein
MQCATHDRATIRVADRTGLSGRATADEVNLDRFHNRIRKVCALVGAALILPAPAQAGPPTSIPAEIAALQAQVAALQTQVNAQQTQITSLQNQGSSDTAQITALQSQLATVQNNKALALGPFVSVDPNPENGVIGPNISFTGANIHIVSGSGATDDNTSNGGKMRGLGNLIIGYDELAPNQVANRGGSHNVIVGRFHTFTSAAFEGLVVAESNTISAEGASVSGGEGNVASGPGASISGGTNSAASGQGASVSGGVANTASGISASVSGGQFNTASGNFASVSGGGSLFINFGNIASGRGASVCGGSLNTATGDFSSILGGGNNIVSTVFGHSP